MYNQLSLSDIQDELSQVMTRKKEFLEQIERIIPWQEWVNLIPPHYYDGLRGNKPYELELMLRIHILQNLYDLADDATSFEVIDSRAFSDFCNISSSNQVPSGDTIGRFRNLLMEANLQETLFQQVVEMLTEKGLILKKGTIVDFSFIEAPTSTKNKKKERALKLIPQKRGINGILDTKHILLLIKKLTNSYQDNYFCQCSRCDINEPTFIGN